MPPKIEHIAWELFRICLENDGDKRYACIGSTKLVARPALGLYECRVVSIPDMFGQQLADHISANPVFKKERQNEDKCTRCIWMVVPLATAECAKINIMLRPREGMMVKALLFPSSQQ